MLNKITIHGYLGRDPELTEENGKNGPYKKATFTVGVSRDYGDSTDWFYCVIYGNRAPVLEKYFSKGSQILVTGSMESYKPKNAPDRTAWLVKVDGFDFCDKANKKNETNETPAIDPEPDELDPDEAPF